MTVSRATRYGVLATGTLLAGGLTYVGLVDPHRPGAVFPRCPFLLLTGWDCPFCGGLRMTHDVLHGDLAGAVADNAFLLLGLPLLAAWGLSRWYRGRPVLTGAMATVLVIAALGWTVLRNLPGFPLAPTLAAG